MLEGRILICKAKSIFHPHSGWFYVSHASRAQQAKALNKKYRTAVNVSFNEHKNSALFLCTYKLDIIRIPF